MQTIDMHVHLLSSKVRFDRLYDKMAIKLFGKKLGLEYEKAKLDPYQAYTDALIGSIRDSRHILKVALFGVDSKISHHGDELHRDATVCATNEDVYQLYKNNEDVIVPFFSINPARLDALDLIDQYSELGFRGAKFLQNYWGVDTRDKKYSKYFQKLSDKKIPLIVHIGSESSVHSVKSCECISMLDAPLYHGVLTIAAHMGLSYSWHKPIKAISKNPKHFPQEYFKLLDMLKHHPNLYADISALLTPVRAKVLPHLSNQDQVSDKLLFATDYPVPFSAIFTSYDLPFSKRFEIEKEENPFDRYAKAILEYFPKNHSLYDNHKKLIVV
ncbi:Putative mannonate dehydratase [Sulfurovum sp. enrichment culture clone C5]|uniref:Putative mannonate dehydratase n=1 Tax=Sulfurovum sp. enrichment culture clone C5 TaxID=497650 RepID=A0A0S4XN42_9BACT|nr:Putative mannonate dehydratase [Sulfurovum sp. enrichment culture clone C5]